jgi:hypothetical protein
LKKLSLKQRRWQQSTVKRFCRKNRLKQRKRLLCRLACLSQRSNKQMNPAATASAVAYAPRKAILAPRAFDLTRGSGTHVMAFLQAIEQRVLLEKRRVKLDFRQTKSFYVPGALMLYAALSKIIAQASMSKPVTIVPPRATLVGNAARQVMRQVGLYDLTHDVVNVRPDREDVIYWKMSKGLTQSGDQLAMLETLAEKIKDIDKLKLQSKDLWRGVTEAVNNTSDHAYEYPRIDGFTGLTDVRWWLLTQLRGKMFTAAVCDLGCGYSKTLKPETLEWFTGLPNKLMGKDNADTRAMQAAMEYGRSRTKLSERGKGSRCALALLEKHGHGELYLLSNSGCLHYECINGVALLKQVTPLAFDIKGTIIWWNLHLGDAL